MHYNAVDGFLALLHCMKVNLYFFTIIILSSHIGELFVSKHLKYFLKIYFLCFAMKGTHHVCFVLYVYTFYFIYLLCFSPSRTLAVFELLLFVELSPTINKVYLILSLNFEKSSQSHLMFQVMRKY